MYAFHCKYLNIVIIQKLVYLWQIKISTSSFFKLMNIKTPFSEIYEEQIRSLYIHYDVYLLICNNCLLYVYSFSFI